MDYDTDTTIDDLLTYMYVYWRGKWGGGGPYSLVGGGGGGGGLMIG